MEKLGIPTVTIATTAFEAMARSEMQKYGAEKMSLVVVEHPIAGRSEEAIRSMADKVFPDLLKAATQGD